MTLKVEAIKVKINLLVQKENDSKVERDKKTVETKSIKNLEFSKRM